MLIVNICRPRKWGKRLRAVFPCCIDKWCQKAKNPLLLTNVCYIALQSLSKIHMWNLYFIWWRKIEKNMLIKSNTALMRWRRTNYAEHNQTASLQQVPDAGDHVIERLTYTSSVRPHTPPWSHLSSFHFQARLKEVSGNWWPNLRYIKDLY